MSTLVQPRNARKLMTLKIAEAIEEFEKITELHVTTLEIHRTTDTRERLNLGDLGRPLIHTIVMLPHRRNTAYDEK